MRERGHAEKRPPTAETLLENFYAWERRGRGWRIWPEPVALEPPFRSFNHAYPSFAYIVDDGRVPTIWSGAIDRLSRWLRPPEREDDISGLAIEEPEPEFVEEPPDLVEFEIALPEGLDVSKPLSDQFLLSLGYCRHPIAFEWIGLPDSIRLQLACDSSDAIQIRQSVAAHFPTSVRTERRGSLLDAWATAGGTERLIVDFGLSREFMFPLQSIGGFSVDPLVPLAGALEQLDPNEIAALQIFFTPVRHPWAASILRAMTDGEGGPFFAAEPATLKLAQRKVARPLFAVSVRLAVKSGNPDRLWGIARGMAGTLAQLADPRSNELIPLENEEALSDDEAHENAFLQRVNHRSGMILNSDELVALAHLPSASVRSKKFRRLVRKTRVLPGLARGHELVLGENEHEGKVEIATQSAEQRMRHTYVVGASGTGKSTFLLNLIQQDVEAGRGLAVLDPHGDLIDQILERIPERRHRDVVVLDPSDDGGIL